MQTKTKSLIEICASTAIGYAVALVSQRLVFPLFGIETTVKDNMWIAGWFTVISLARGYCVRRVFNWIEKGKI